MTILDYLLVVLIVGYCAYIMFAKKKTGCSGDCSGCGCCCSCRKGQ